VIVVLEWMGVGLLCVLVVPAALLSHKLGYALACRFTTGMWPSERDRMVEKRLARLG
jgi:hypothetical protein